jgi:hypothetical protein
LLAFGALLAQPQPETVLKNALRFINPATSPARFGFIGSI